MISVRSWCISLEVNILLGCPSTPSKCCKPKSHNTAIVAVAVEDLVEVSDGLVCSASILKTRIAANTAKSAAILRTRWKWPTT